MCKSIKSHRSFPGGEKESPQSKPKVPKLLKTIDIHTNKNVILHVIQVGFEKNEKAHGIFKRAIRNPF